MDGMTWIVITVMVVAFVIVFFDKILPWLLNK